MTNKRKTLLVDGNDLFKIGFHGVKDKYHNGEHIGGIYHFINTLQKFLTEHSHDKVVVFWDGENNSSNRRLIYPNYKSNRVQSMNDYKYESYLYQKERVKQYLEEIFVRQIEVSYNEADDMIAYYCSLSNEEIIISSSDKDLTQLISEKITVYSQKERKYFKYGDTIRFKDIEIPHYNVVVFKILVGDVSDNIPGILGLGNKTLIKILPEILDKKMNLTDVFDILKSKSNLKSKIVKNILTGTSKNGILGDEFYSVNKLLIDLSSPSITEDAKTQILQIYSDDIDPTDRDHKNLMRMMITDGVMKFLPKSNDDFFNFLKPFLVLSNKEKNR